MSCNTGCDTLGENSYEDTTQTLHASSIACGNPAVGVACSNSKSYVDYNSNTTDLTGCGVCAVCGGGTPHFTTNGSGRVFCYTGAGCGTPCSGTPEPVAIQSTDTRRASTAIPALLLNSLILCVVFFLFVRRSLPSLVKPRGEQ